MAKSNFNSLVLLCSLLVSPTITWVCTRQSTSTETLAWLSSQHHNSFTTTTTTTTNFSSCLISLLLCSYSQLRQIKYWMSSYPESKLIPKERDATRLCWLSHASTGIQTTATSAGKNDV